MKTVEVGCMQEFDAMSLKDVASNMESKCEFFNIDEVNWPDVTNCMPLCKVAVAYSSHKLYVHFMVDDEDLRAVNTANLSSVADDSCVEFFMQVPGSKEYWNFEFNCIGAVNASHRETRPNAIRLTDDEISSIDRYASLGTRPFSLLQGKHFWTLTVAIPFSLVGLDENCTHLMGNFYKCGGKTKHPHYVSWNAIEAPKPNFHLPEYFGKILLAGK